MSLASCSAESAVSSIARASRALATEGAVNCTDDGRAERGLLNMEGNDMAKGKKLAKAKKLEKKQTLSKGSRYQY